jgi:hypothetical protein
LIATEYFTTGGEVIETGILFHKKFDILYFYIFLKIYYLACNDIDQWPLPIPGEPIILPLLGHLIEVKFIILYIL